MLLITDGGWLEAIEIYLVVLFGFLKGLIEYFAKLEFVYSSPPLVGLHVVHLHRAQSVHEAVRGSTTHCKDLPIESGKCWEVATLPHGREPPHL